MSPKIVLDLNPSSATFYLCRSLGKALYLKSVVFKIRIVNLSLMVSQDLENIKRKRHYLKNIIPQIVPWGGKD